MGHAYGSQIARAAGYLLEVLTERGAVEYSEFYDGTDATADRLAVGLRMSVEDAEYYCAELQIDLAAAQLEERGVVKIEPLDSKLADGEPNYRVSWKDDKTLASVSWPDASSDEAPKVRVGGRLLKFRDVEL